MRRNRVLHLALAALFAAATATATAASAQVPAGAAAMPSGHPDSPPARVIARRIIGHSVDGRPIIAYHLGDPKLKRVSLVLGQMHGDEPAGVALARSIIHAHGRLAGINLWVIPTMNPDGFAADTRQNADGVDLNRNWPYKWKHLTGQYYSGSHPLSAPEAKAMHRFLVHLRPHFFVSIHQPLHGVDTTYGPEPVRRFAVRLTHYLHLPSTPLRCWSVCHGSMTNWYVHRRLGLAQTVEFGSHPAHHWLVGRERRALVRALHGHYVHHG